jgi:SPP1 family predicted phage head-tail adaptor
MKNNFTNLNKRAVLQKEVISLDDFGGYSSSWQDVLEVWISINPVSFENKIYGFKKDSQMTHIVIARYNESFEIGRRLLLNGRDLRINSISRKMESDDFVEINVSEINK